LVRGVQRATRLFQDGQQPFRLDPAFPGEDPGERLPADHLHHQVGEIVAALGVRNAGGRLAVVVHRGDARVVERGRGACLGAEPVQELGVPGQLGLEDLHRHRPVQPGVRGLPHLTHTADRDARVQAVSVGEQQACGGRHWPSSNAAVSVRRPISEASAPPVAARSPCFPPLSTITATATFGSSYGANAVYHACGGVCFGFAPCSAVPVFEAIFRWEYGPAPSVFCSDLIIMSRSTSALCRLNAGSPVSSSGSTGSRTDSAGASSSLTRCGRIAMPWLAMVAESIASCKGVRRTSRCPMPAWYSSASEPSSPSPDGVTLIGISRSSIPMPKFFAVSRSLSAPSWPASLANAVLHEWASAS